MNNKLTLIIAIIGIALIIVGAFFVVNSNMQNSDVNGTSLKIPLQKHDFKLFEINVPEGSNFTVKNQKSSMIYYQNTGEYGNDLTGIIICKNITDDLIGDKSVSVINSTTEKVYSSEVKNKTIYKHVSIQDGCDIILIGDDLNLLKEIADTIKIKDISSL